MKKLKEIFLEWLRLKLQPLVERKFVMKETWELEKIEHKGVKLPYVLLENKSIVINKFRIPIKLESVRLQIYNKDQIVGRILYDGGAYLFPKSQQSVTMEVRLSHITAFFQMVRFFIIDTIRMDIKGEIQLRILGMTFFIPVSDTFDMPKSKFKMIAKVIREDKTSPTTIPFEDVLPDIQEENLSNEIPDDINASASSEHAP